MLTVTVKLIMKVICAALTFFFGMLNAVDNILVCSNAHKCVCLKMQNYDWKLMLFSCKNTAANDNMHPKE